MSDYYYQPAWPDIRVERKGGWFFPWIASTYIGVHLCLTTSMTREGAIRKIKRDARNYLAAEVVRVEEGA